MGSCYMTVTGSLSGNSILRLQGVWTHWALGHGTIQHNMAGHPL